MPRNFIGICCLFLCLIACGQQKMKNPPEKRFLKVLQEELATIESFQDNYLGYMQFQIKNFSKKIRRTNHIITEINMNFANLPAEEQSFYQREWREKFQPVVDDIQEKTRLMVIKQTENLNKEKMGQLQELAIKLEMLEKETEAVYLAPIFFQSANKGDLK